MGAERLQKILSHAGVSSRRTAEQMILAGRVAVNGTTVTELGSRADPEHDEVTVDGVPVNRARYRYVMLHKPTGYVTSARDEYGRATVLDLVKGARETLLHPVGRLDRDSEGLLLLTNDGHLTNLLSHPRYEVEKEYLVWTDARVGDRDLQRLTRGVDSEGERLRAESISRVAPPNRGQEEHCLRLVLREGKNREIRRMLAALGRKAVTLRRVRTGPVNLGSLERGRWRELSEAEVVALYATGKRAESSAGASMTYDPGHGQR